jgi:hypothetical protein
MFTRMTWGSEGRPAAWTKGRSLGQSTTVSRVNISLTARLKAHTGRPSTRQLTRLSPVRSLIRSQYHHLSACLTTLACCCCSC